MWAKNPKHQHPWTLTFGLTREARDDVALSFGSLGRRNFDWSIPSTWMTSRSLMLSHASSWSVQQMHRSAYWSDKCLRYCKTVASFCSKLVAFTIASLKWKQSSHWLNLACSYIIHDVCTPIGPNVFILLVCLIFEFGQAKSFRFSF